MRTTRYQRRRNVFWDIHRKEPEMSYTLPSDAFPSAAVFNLYSIASGGLANVKAHAREFLDASAVLADYGSQFVFGPAATATPLAQLTAADALDPCPALASRMAALTEPAAESDRKKVAAAFDWKTALLLLLKIAEQLLGG